MNRSHQIDKRIHFPEANFNESEEEDSLWDPFIIIAIEILTDINMDPIGQHNQQLIELTIQNMYGRFIKCLRIQERFRCLSPRELTLWFGSHIDGPARRTPTKLQIVEHTQYSSDRCKKGAQFCQNKNLYALYIRL